MPKLKQISGKELIKILKKLGFEETRIKGSYHGLAHQNGRKTSVPIHGNEPMGIGLLLKIVRQDLKITGEEFEKLLEE